MNGVRIKVPLQLEGKAFDGAPWVTRIDASPFVIGRGDGVHLRLTWPGVSRQHAEIRETPEGWVISDCGSTNGTYVNGRRLSGEHVLEAKDTVRIAEMQFSVVEQSGLAESTQVISPYTLHFELMMRQRAVTAPCQPIVSLKDGALFGYEMLGRVLYPSLPEDLGALFEVARKVDREVELCTLFREVFLQEVAGKSVDKIVFFNVHPKEMTLERLKKVLTLMRRGAPGLALGMELHENAVAGRALMLELRKLLDELDIRLVYDDFGAGQARLIQLLDTTPDYLKFDLSLIRDIHLRPEPSRSIVGALVKMARDAGIRTLAEGVECEEEAEVCRALGFDLAQGYHFGRPAPLP